MKNKTEINIRNPLLLGICGKFVVLRALLMIVFFCPGVLKYVVLLY